MVKEAKMAEDKKSVTTTIKESFFDDPFFKVRHILINGKIKQKCRKN